MTDARKIVFDDDVESDLDVIGICTNMRVPIHRVEKTGCRNEPCYQCSMLFNTDYTILSSEGVQYEDDPVGMTHGRLCNCPRCRLVRTVIL